MPNQIQDKLKEEEAITEFLHNHPLIRPTPFVKNAQHFLPELKRKLPNVSLSLKLENMQNEGSFKIRGVVRQMDEYAKRGQTDRKLVTYSAGNYGRAFAFVAQKMGFPALVVMPKTAPQDRVDLIRSYGADVEQGETSELLNIIRSKVENENMLLLHSFDDLELIKAYGSIANEIRSEFWASSQNNTDYQSNSQSNNHQMPSIVIVPLGGGGLISGIAAGIRNWEQAIGSTKPIRIIGVEPENAAGMSKSLAAGRVVSIPAQSVASGLAPPSPGPNTLDHVQRLVNTVITVSDTEIVEAMRMLADGPKVIVEPAGAAGIAALMSERFQREYIQKPNPLMTGEVHVCVILSGGNITLQQFSQLLL